MTDQEKALRDWLKQRTDKELYLLKIRLIHEEQLRRQGIVTTPPKPKD